LKKLLHMLMTYSYIGYTHIEVDDLLHTRGTDFSIYRNEFAARGADVVGEKDTDLLQMIVFELMTNRHSGVESMRVENYRLEIRHSRAVTGEYVLGLAANAAKDAGYAVSFETRKSWVRQDDQIGRAITGGYVPTTDDLSDVARAMLELYLSRRRSTRLKIRALRAVAIVKVLAVRVTSFTKEAASRFWAWTCVNSRRLNDWLHH